MGQGAAGQVGGRHRQLAEFRFLHLADVARGDALARFDNEVALVVDDVEADLLSPQPLGHQAHADLLG